MPVRKHYDTVACRFYSSTSDWPTMSQYALYKNGYEQAISALNNVGTFTAGKLRLNPVIISKAVFKSTPATYTPKVSDGSRSILMVSGHVAAVVSELVLPLNLKDQFENYVIWDMNAAQYSLQKAQNKASEPDLDVGIIIGELRETIAGLANPLSALRKYVRQYNKLTRKGIGRLKKNYDDAADLFDMTSGSWLEWRYGINPLIITIESAIEVIQQKSLELDEKLLRTRAKVKLPRKYVPMEGGGCAIGFFSGTLRGGITIDTTYHTSIFYSLNKPLTWQQRFGLDLSNLASVAWEVVPLSFVGDWFVGIGNFIGSIRFHDGRTMLGSCTTQKTEIIGDWFAELKFQSQPAYNTGSRLSCEYKRINRMINLTPSMMPSMNPAPLSFQRTLDAISLSWQKMPKPRR